jgi:hypothetical protein
MKREWIIFNNRIYSAGQLIITYLLFTIIGQSQISKEISLSVYPGFTFVNYEKRLGISNDYLMDNDHIHLGAAIRAFLLSENQIQLGAEVGIQKLYYAHYIIPGDNAPEDQEFKANTVSLMILGRQFVNKFFFIGGAGIHFFGSGVSAALCLETGYMFYAGENLQIPLSLRINPIFGTGTLYPVSIGAGLSYTIR